MWWAILNGVVSAGVILWLCMCAYDVGAITGAMVERRPHWTDKEGGPLFSFARRSIKKFDAEVKAEVARQMAAIDTSTNLTTSAK